METGGHDVDMVAGLARVLVRRGGVDAPEAELARELHGLVDPVAEAAHAGAEGARAAALSLRAELVGACGEDGRLAGLGTWMDSERARSLARDIGVLYGKGLGEPAWVARDLLHDNLEGLLKVVARLARARDEAQEAGRGDETARLRALLREVRAQAAYALLAPLAVGVRDSLLWDAEASVARAEGALKARPGDEPTAVAAINELCRILGAALRTCPLPSALPAAAKGSTRVAQAALMNINQFAWGIPSPLFFSHAGGGGMTRRDAAGWDARVRAKIFTDHELGQPGRGKRLQSQCIAGWSQVEGGEWVAVRRAQLGLARWARLMDGDGELLLEDPEGKLPSVTVRAKDAVDVVKKGARRVRALREIALEHVLRAQGRPDAWIGAFFAAMSHRGLYDLGSPLARMPMWEDEEQTEAVLEASRVYLALHYDPSLVDALLEEVSDRFAHFRAARRASSARARRVPGTSAAPGSTYGASDAHRELAQALTELAVAFILSPGKACGLMADQETEDPEEIPPADPFAPLSASDRLTLTIRAGSGDRSPAPTLEIDGREVPAGAVELRGVVGRQAAEGALRSDREGADASSWRSDGAARPSAAERLAEALARVAAQARAEDPAAAPLAPCAPDFVDGADAWAEAGNDWRMVGGDAAVSGVHLAIAAADGSYWAADAGSKGGTVVARLLGRDAETGARTVELLRMRGAVRADGGRHDEGSYRHVRQRFGAFNVEERTVEAVRLRYGDVILIGSATELRVAWL